MREGQYQSGDKTINFTDAKTVGLASRLYQVVDKDYKGSPSIESTRLEEIIRHLHAGMPLTDDEWNILRDIKSRHQDELQSLDSAQDPAVPQGSGRISEALVTIPHSLIAGITESYRTASTTEQDKNTTSPHLLDGALHDLAHAKQHADRMDAKDVKGNKSSQEFNLEHLVKHLISGMDHISRLGKHLEKHATDPSVFRTERSVLHKLREEGVPASKPDLPVDTSMLSKAPTICVDFDGVIHQGPHGLPGRVMGILVDGSAKGLKELSTRFRVVVLTARVDLQAVRDWLDAQKVGQYVDEVTNRKPAASAYIDDRATHFTDWPTALKAVDPAVPVLEIPKPQKSLKPSKIEESEAEIRKIKEGMPKPPPGLDVSNDPNKRCGNCDMNYGGECWGYNRLPIRREWLCRSWAPDSSMTIAEADPILLQQVRSIFGL